MLLISIVLIAAFSFVFYSTSNYLENESITAMKSISSHLSDAKKNNSIFGNNIMPDEKDEYSYFKTFTIETNNYSKTFIIDGYEVAAEDINDQDNDYLNKLINAVYTSENDEGILEEYNLRYYAVDSMFGKCMVFLDKEYEDTTLSRLILTFVIVGTGALTAFLFISVIIARIAVAPVEKSMKQQMQLVADASHELKTPITVISANADILLSNKDSSICEQVKWVEYIKTESTRMTELVNNMLFLAKTDENKNVEAQYIINLSDIVNSCILPFESICYEKKKGLNIVIAPDVYIKGNENSIKQLIIILVDNAFKYSDENGRIKVIVTTEQDKVLLSVWNTGNPIPENQLPHIFERFFKVDKSRSRTEGGYGLGLSIAKNITDSHNAKIFVQSSEHNGTMFTCVFKKQKNI